MEHRPSPTRPSGRGVPSSFSSDDGIAFVKPLPFDWIGFLEAESKFLSEQNLKVIKCRKTAEIAHYGDIVDLRPKRPQELMSTATSSSESTANTHIGKPSSGLLVKPLIEVFSVSLDIAPMECCILGTIEIGNMDRLYSRAPGCSEIVISYGSISLERNCQIDADTEFRLKIDLSEGWKMFKISKGDIRLSKSVIEKYWNKRLCSTVRGDFGFAAVHYSPIKAALVATVNVRFGCNSSTSNGKIYGSLTASYGACAYSTFHDEEYFRSRLFNRGPRSDEDNLKEISPSVFEVVSSIVAVPEGSSLIIQGSLHADEKTNVYLKVEILPDLHKSSRKIEGENCYALISVRWEPHNDEVVGLATGAEIMEKDTDGGTHVFGTPMVEVFSIRIRSCSEDTERSFDISGQIGLIMGSRVFPIYSREFECPQTVGEDGFLHLNGLHLLRSSSEYGIKAVGPLSIYMNLRDNICGTKCVSNFHYSLLDGAGYDKGQYTTIDFATLYWATIRDAVLAVVEVRIIKWGDVEGSDIQVYGSVIAEYGKNNHYQLSRPPGEEHNFRITLFDVPQSQPVSTVVGSPMRLSRNVVTVPSCSSLVVKANLWDGGSGSEIIRGEIAEFAACHDGTRIEIHGGIIQVKVTWEYRPSDIFPSKDPLHAEDHIIRQRLANNDEVHQLRMVRGMITDGEVREPPLEIGRGPYDGKNMKIREPPLHASRFSCGSQVQSLSGYSRLEVFSIFLGGIDKKCKVYGTVDVGDGDFLLYSRTKDDAEVVSPCGTISMGLVGDGLIRSADSFRMSIVLKDVDDHAMVRGLVGLNLPELDRRCYKRLCSIVRGPRGYAAVHYTTFNNAMGASIRVKLLTNGDRTTMSISRVYGHLMAHYGGRNYYYDTDYTKAYYRIRLFDRSEDDMAQVTMADDDDGGIITIPLLKSLVVVPVWTSLIVWGELFFCATNGKRIASPPIHVEMWPQTPDGVFRRVKLQENSCSLEVGVKWCY